LKVECNKKSDGIEILVAWKAFGIKQASTRYLIDNNGSIEILHKASSKKMVLLKVAMSFGLNQDYNDVTWLGRGYEENYSDRKTGSKIGLYHASVQELQHPYMRPQENGHRSDNKFLEIKNSKNNKINISSIDSDFGFNIYPYSIEYLDKITHRHLLVDQGLRYVSIDGAMSGVGGDLPGMISLREPYILHPKTEYQVHFKLQLKLN
ncbi:MAG: hypothetical protein Q8T08_04065, partial [Ignavibacteria bacterium]|nr:hypothetical protein [Ignavibacteria bacterium]